MVRELTAKRPLDQRLLEPPRRGFDFFRGEWTVADDLVENSAEMGARTSGARFSGFDLRGIQTPHGMPHTQISDSLSTRATLRLLRLVDSPTLRLPDSFRLPDSSTPRLFDSPTLVDSPTLQTLLASLAIITSVDLITASASSPRFSRSASMASRVMMAVSDWSPMRRRICAISPSVRTSSTTPRS
jgi:hypothetical protein